MQCNVSEIFSDSSLHRFIESEISGVTFVYENSLTWGREMWKIELKKVVGNLLEKLRKLYVNETVN